VRWAETPTEEELTALAAEHETGNRKHTAPKVPCRIQAAAAGRCLPAHARKPIRALVVGRRGLLVRNWQSRGTKVVAQKVQRGADSIVRRASFGDNKAFHRSLVEPLRVRCTAKRASRRASGRNPEGSDTPNRRLSDPVVMVLEWLQIAAVGFPSPAFRSLCPLRAHLRRPTRQCGTVHIVSDESSSCGHLSKSSCDVSEHPRE